MRIKSVDGAVYDFTPALYALIMSKHPRPNQWNSRDYQAYKSLSAQTKVRLFPNSAGAVRSHATWKYKQMLRKMVPPGKKIEEEESEDTDDAASTASESSTVEPDFKPSTSGVELDFAMSPAHTRSGKAKKEKDREPFL